jgi:hypothetical protein
MKRNEEGNRLNAEELERRTAPSRLIVIEPTEPPEEGGGDTGPQESGTQQAGRGHRNGKLNTPKVKD